MARTIGIGKPSTRSYAFRKNVFHMMFPNLNEEKNRSKLAKPIHGLPQMPLEATNRLNAITLPYMGRYMNTTSQITGSSAIRYSSQLIEYSRHALWREASLMARRDAASADSANIPPSRITTLSVGLAQAGNRKYTALHPTGVNTCK